MLEPLHEVGPFSRLRGKVAPKATEGGGHAPVVGAAPSTTPRVVPLSRFAGEDRRLPTLELLK